MERGKPVTQDNGTNNLLTAEVAEDDAKDPRGEILEGWPIGFYEYEHPRHKTTSDRIDMARLASQEMKCMQCADIVLVDSLPGDPFLNKFGAWPDQAFCLDSELAAADNDSVFMTNRLLYRGQFVQGVGDEMGGWRVGDFTREMEKACF